MTPNRQYTLAFPVKLWCCRSVYFNKEEYEIPQNAGTCGTVTVSRFSIYTNSKKNSKRKSWKIGEKRIFHPDNLLFLLFEYAPTEPNGAQLDSMLSFFLAKSSLGHHPTAQVSIALWHIAVTIFLFISNQQVELLLSTFLACVRREPNRAQLLAMLRVFIEFLSLGIYPTAQVFIVLWHIAVTIFFL